LFLYVPRAHRRYHVKRQTKYVASKCTFDFVTRMQFGVVPVTGEIQMHDKYTTLTECTVDRQMYARQETKDLK